MIITLKNADFSKSNIGTLNTYSIIRSLGMGAIFSGPVFVNKDAPLNATVTLEEGYELGEAGISIIMGGVELTDCYTIVDNTISIAITNVTSNVSIKVSTVNTSTGEEDSGGAGNDFGVIINVSIRTTNNTHAQTLPNRITSTTNLWNTLTPEAKYYDSTGSYIAYQKVGSIVFPVLAGDKLTASSFGRTIDSSGYTQDGIRITYLLDNTSVKTMTATEVNSEYKSNGYVTVPSGVNTVCIPVWDNAATDNEVYLFPAEATSGTPTKPSNFDNTGSGSGGSTPGGDGVQDTSGATWYVNHLANGSKCTNSVNIAGRGWAHVPGSAAYNAYVGKPVNTIGFFTDKASQNVTIGKVTEKGGVGAMETIATVTAVNPSGATKGFCYITFPTVTLAQGECLAMFAQDDDNINFYYNGSSSLTDANGVVDNNFYGRVPKVYGSGTAWTDYPTQKICLGISVGYIAS